MSIRENNSKYKPVKKNELMVWIANEVEMEKLPSGIYRPQETVSNEILKLREGVIVEINSECFKENQFEIIPKKNDEISFRSYSGDIYLNEITGDYYRIFEDKFVGAIVNKK